MMYFLSIGVILIILLGIYGGGYGEQTSSPYYFNKLINDFPPEASTPSKFNGGEYDFIVVGSGSAGAVIANRLSEIKHWNILLLEVGDMENFIAEIPAMAGILQLTDYNWGYVTEPQSHACLAMVEHRCASPRGKALGGTSVINSMIYTRGNPEDYDKWAALGNPGWSYADVLPYFLKSEASRLNDSNENYHNTEGELSVEHPYMSELGHAFLAAGQELGYHITDHNSPYQIGFSKLQTNMKRGRRHSTANAFLKPILHRKNLKIVMEAMVTKILVDHFTNRAYGVTYNWKGKKFSVRATKEVVLSAGVYGSAQLLMLSGVGPKLHLEELGISTIRDLPVGQTMYNHLAFNGLVINTDASNSGANGINALELLRWYKTGEGPLTSAAGSEALAFLNTGISQTEDYPDIELVLVGSSLSSNNGTIQRTILRISDDYYNKMYSSTDTNVSFTIVALLLHPKSKGFMRLKSSNPYDYPLLYANYLTDPEKHDVRTLIAAIRIISRLIETSAFKQYNAEISKKPFVGCEHLPFDSNAYWECALNIMGFPVNHVTSTCKMGPVNDDTAVVDHELKVHGIGNLRVADTSIIPFSLSAHTHAPAVMVGEKASDLIKEEWGLLPNKEIL